MTRFQTDVVLDPESGHALSAEHQRIAEIISEYDPHLELVWIPPNDRNSFVKPFAVRHNPPGRESYIVFYLGENEVDHRVLTRLFMGDNAKGDILGEIEADEAAKKLVDMKRQIDANEEAKEITEWALKARAGAKHKGVRFE